MAKEEKLSGWVRNVADGSVEALLEGEQESVDRVVRWAKRGPPGARVDLVEVERAEVMNLKGFEIKG
ncbi:MAG: acylphosphatase [Nitrososphaerales archaeon]|nr:acylphosphatase [Nitrososphaerales archaeon]